MLYATAVGLGAFLLFQIQPIAAGTILPWFGGSAAVWSTCLLFFQSALLLGYLYARWLDRRLAPRAQAWIHISLLGLSVALLPVVANIDWKPHAIGDPALRILALLTATVGLPYGLLATTGPLLQSWYRGANNSTSPYRLYALSNAGSLLALLSYPVVVEPFLSRQHQALMWASAYVVYGGLTATIALRRRRDAPAGGAAPGEGPSPAWGIYLLWIALAACASALLVSITSHLSQNVAPVPFLWVLPLSLYLLSFIICFSHDRAYWRSIWLPLAAIALGGMAYGLFGNYEAPSLYLTIGAFLSGLFLCCMFCHGELARTKPDPSHLTSFYVAVAVGGAMGSLFAGLLAPHLFVGDGELPVALVSGALLLAAVLYRDRSRTRRRAAHVLRLAPVVVLAATLTVYVWNGLREHSSDARLAARNFYGSLRLFDAENEQGEKYRQLFHGTIDHGAQLLDPSRSCEPITYYGPESGIGLLFAREDRPTPARVGVIGLGTATLAGFARPGDEFRFYEINPLVVRLARTEFSFLDGCGARVDIVQGDARLSLEREPSQQFDILAMDAFSGDSIPVHLLTQEALELFFRHLKPSGVLAVNISNRYVDLQPVLARLARRFGKDLLLVDAEGDGNLLYPSVWGLLSAPDGVLQEPSMNAEAEEIEEPADDGFLWTDDYSSLWKVLY